MDFDIETQSPKYSSFIQKIIPFLNESNHIIHAGDVCSEKFIEILSKYAQISVVRGNMDEYEGLTKWPKKLELEFESIKIGIAHKLEEVLMIPGIRVAISGHTHIPEIKEIKPGILTINPGSPTQPRKPNQKKFFDKDIGSPTIAQLTIDDGILSGIIKRL
jgi:putative phosphoesterase